MAAPTKSVAYKTLPERKRFTPTGAQPGRPPNVPPPPAKRGSADLAREIDVLPGTVNKRSVSPEATSVAQGSWLEAYRTTRAFGAALTVVGLSSHIVRAWQKTDAAFAKRVQHVQDEIQGELEDATIKRALEKSDLLAMFHLKAMAPEKYREAISPDTKEKVDELLDEIRKLPAKAKQDARAELGRLSKERKALKGGDGGNGGMDGGEG